MIDIHYKLKIKNMEKIIITAMTNEEKSSLLLNSSIGRKTITDLESATDKDKKFFEDLQELVTEYLTK